MGRTRAPRRSGDARAWAVTSGAHGEKREVTILNTDLRDFTALSETLTGADVVVPLNECHAARRRSPGGLKGRKLPLASYVPLQF